MGKKSQWQAISIGNNSALTSATIHYNETAPTPTPTAKPTPTPTPKPTPIPTTTATVIKSETDTTYNFDVTPKATYANCHVYAAIYDESGALLAVNRVPLEMAGSTSISVNKSANDVLAKVFIFADTLQPIIEKAEEFSLAN